MLVKLTRHVRMLFYGLQVLLATCVLGDLLARSGEEVLYRYYLLPTVVPIAFVALFIVRNKKKRRVERCLPPGYPWPINERADGRR